MSATLLQPPTRSGLLPEARHLVLPEGIASSGWPAAEKTGRTIGIAFDSWQQALNKCILAKGPTGLYAADTVVMSIPRQVGKTYDVGGIVFTDSIINPGTTTVWTAHRFKVARETFNELRGIATTAALAPHIDPDDIYTAAGNESITFRNGSRIVFAARERGAIRGFTKVRRLILDEAQILTEAAMSDLAPTQNQAVNPQIILMGTPPKPTDPGETFANLRDEALAGTAEGVLYVEFSADPDCDIDDEEAWAQANPSLHVRTPVSAIRRLRKLLSNDDDFRREALGIWPDKREDDPWGVIDRRTWNLRSVGGDGPGWLDGAVCLAVEADQSLTRTCIAVAGDRPDRIGATVVLDHPGTSGVVDAIVAKCAETSVSHVVIDSRSPAAVFIEPLTEAGVTVTSPKTGEVTTATSTLRQLFQDDGIEVRSTPELDRAAAVAKLRKAGESQAIDRWGDQAAVPLIAVNLAVWGHQNRPTVENPEPDFLVL